MPLLEIALHGHLLVGGGQVTALGTHQATARCLLGGEQVPYIPATALRGAVRLQLEALLRGAGHEATGPYPLDTGDEIAAPAPPPDPHDNTVARLFGFCGPPGARQGSKEGIVRFSDALPIDPAEAVRRLAVRAGVELDDYTCTAAEHKLFFREIAETDAEPLLFHAHLDVGETGEEDLRRLRAAVETTDAIGGGKASGGGEVTIRWRDSEQPVRTRVSGDQTTATRARLVFTLLETMHIGDGGPMGNHHPTKTCIPGATVRGAVAWSLLREGKLRPQEPEFQALFLGRDGTVSFGDALVVSAPDQEPSIRPVTSRQLRSSADVTDILVRELARDRVQRKLPSGQYLRPSRHDIKGDPMEARPAPGIVRRTRTRVAIDRLTGTSREGKLFTKEQVEPWSAQTGEPAESRRVCLVSWIEDLNPIAAAGLAEKLPGTQVLVGAGRNHGMGLVELQIELLPEPEGAQEELGQVLQLEEQVARAAREMAALAGIADRPETGETAMVALALMATSDFIPTETIPHPLAILAPEAGDPVRRFLGHGVCGGYNQLPDGAGGEQGPLKSLVETVAAGSVLVYEVARDQLESMLGQVLPALRRGIGDRAESGCGRFSLFQEARS